MEKITRLALLQPKEMVIEIKIVTDTVFEGELLKSENVRTLLTPETNIVATLSGVDSFLIGEKRPPLPEQAIKNITAFADSFFTDDIKEAWANRPQEAVA